MHHRHPAHDGYPAHRALCTHYEPPTHPATVQWTMATPRIPVMPNTSGISCTVDAYHTLCGHLTSPRSVAPSMPCGPLHTTAILPSVGISRSTDTPPAQAPCTPRLPRSLQPPHALRALRVPPSVAPPARGGCGLSVGAPWAAAPTWRVPAPASASRSPAAALPWKQARCLCHLGKGNRGTSAGTAGNKRTGCGGGPWVPPAPRPSLPVAGHSLGRSPRSQSSEWEHGLLQRR